MSRAWSFVSVLFRLMWVLIIEGGTWSFSVIQRTLRGLHNRRMNRIMHNDFNHRKSGIIIHIVIFRNVWK